MMTDGRTCVHKKSRLLSYDWLESRSNSSSHTSSSSIAACDDRSRVKEPNQKFHKSLRNDNFSWNLELFKKISKKSSLFQKCFRFRTSFTVANNSANEFVLES